MELEVDPVTLLFTQESIALKFQAPRENEKIDDAVDAILDGKLRASDFPRLKVVKHEGRLWSLDNRRLWVFRNARVPSITVNLVPYVYLRRKFPNQQPELNIMLQQKGFLPKVRGKCRKLFRMRGGYQAYQPIVQTAPVEKKRAEPPVEPIRILRPLPPNSIPVANFDHNLPERRVTRASNQGAEEEEKKKKTKMSDGRSTMIYNPQVIFRLNINMVCGIVQVLERLLSSNWRT